jgi:hypothetical protein
VEIEYMKKILLSLLIFIVFLTGCDSVESPPSEPAFLVGSDKDEHGCIGSAGYQWCAQTAECERPWELAKKIGFGNTSDEFMEYCGG